MRIRVYSKKSEKRSTFFDAGYDFNVLSASGRNYVLTQRAKPKHVYARIPMVKEADHDTENGWIGRCPQDEIPDADRLVAHV